MHIVQTAAVAEILRGGDVLLASHTGSGKTLAYLLPLVKLLRDAEKRGEAQSKPKRPRAIVLGPTRELTDQILSVAKSISHHAKFRSACVNGGGSMGQQKEALTQPLDILVGTPQKLVQHAEKGHLFWGDVQYVVLDEADTMFDKGFGPEVKAVLGPLRSKAQPASAILVVATLSQAVRKLLDAEFPGLKRVETSSLHRGVLGARHSFLAAPPDSNKLDVLAQVVTGEAARGRRLMVFCNTLDSCRATEHHLRERGVPTLCYHGDIPLDGRRQAIAQFSAAEPGPEGQPVLVCTDLAARGLDMPGRVDHVVNFDFPLNPMDYIHRTGRTARAGASGRITSIVTKRDAVLAGRIEAALAANQPLDDLSAAKGVLPAHMRPKPETLKRKEEEAAALRNSRKGLRGAARVAAGRLAAGRPSAPVKGGSKTVYGPPKPRSASPGFARKSGAVGTTGRDRKGPFAFSATVQGSANSDGSNSSSSSTSGDPSTGSKYSRAKAETGGGSGRKFSKNKPGSSSGSSGSGNPSGQKGKSIRLGGRRGENKVKAAFLRSK
ncbi:g9970 [Coccomyxa elongata]